MNYRERIAKTVGERVRKVREYHQLSQSDLAAVLEKTPTGVNAGENGRHSFTVSDLEKICKKFKDITPNHLMGYEPLPNKYQK